MRFNAGVQQDLDYCCLSVYVASGLFLFCILLLGFFLTIFFSSVRAHSMCM